MENFLWQKSNKNWAYNNTPISIELKLLACRGFSVLKISLETAQNLLDELPNYSTF